MRHLLTVVRFGAAVALADLAAASTVILICLLGGWRTRADLGHGLVYAGMILLAIAGLGAAAYLGGGARPEVVSSRTLPLLPFSPRDQARLVGREHAAGLAPAPLWLLAAGVAALVVGLLLA